MLSLIAKILKALNSDTRPSQIAIAIAFAFLVGFNGFTSVIGLGVIVCLFFIRCNLSIFIALSAVFALLSLMLSPLLSLVGESVLTASSLNSFWQDLYQTYWFRVFDLNNTLVMGNAVVSLIMLVPVYFIGYQLVVKYRNSIMAFVNKFKIVQTLKASKFYRLYSATQG